MSKPQLVHGMGRELVPPDWPPLTAPEVTVVLAEYGLDLRGLTWRSPRPFSSAALVATRQGEVFVKRHARSVRSPGGLAEEHALADHLRQRGVPTPAVLRTLDGATVVAGDGWTWEVHARGAGADTYRDVPSWQPFRSASHAFAAGAALARLQHAAADFAAPARRPQPLVTSWQAVPQPDLLAALRAFVADRPLLAQALAGRAWERDVEQVLVPLHARLVPHLAALPPSWTHGDGHASNLLWSPGGEVTAVLDLGLCDRTTPLLDLATAIERNCVPWLAARPRARLDLVDALVDGWSSERPLSPAEAAALPDLLPLAHVELALSELAYFAGIVGSTANAELAYDGYLLGHARWFTGPDGAALLDHLGSRRRPVR